MKQVTIRMHLQRAAEEIATAREESITSDNDDYLDGIERLLSHHEKGDATHSEAIIYPEPGALDIVQNRLSKIIDETEDPAVEHLRNARMEILQTILMLDERKNEAKSKSRWR